MGGDKEQATDVPQAASPVDAALEGAFDAFERLDALLAKLICRLEPVLTPLDTISTERPPESLPDSVSSPIATRISNLAVGVESLAGFVSWALNRLEV